MTARRRKINPVYFETTIPVIRWCACGAVFAAGVAEGIKAEVELVPLDLGQKLWAIVNHIELFGIMRSGLVRMDQHRLTDPRFRTLFPQHYCHVKWPRPPKRAFRRLPLDDTPPF